METLNYAMRALRETHLQSVWVVGSLIITASVLVHGISATPLIRRYGKYLRCRGDKPEQQQEEQHRERQA